MNKDAHFDENGDRILSLDSEYIWLGDIVGKRNSIPFMNLPKSTPDKTFLRLKEAVNNNFLGTNFMNASAGMAVHYEEILVCASALYSKGHIIPYSRLFILLLAQKPLAKALLVELHLHF